MMFDLLTPNAECILREILDTRFEDGSCNTEYWMKKCEHISFAERNDLLSTLHELSNSRMISFLWADGYPYFLTVLNNGLTYFEVKENEQKKSVEEKNATKKHDYLLTIITILLTGIVSILLYKLFGIGG